MKKTLLASALSLFVAAAYAEPPPHAKAHGYHKKHQEHELIRIEQRPVYRIEERPGVYFVEDDEYFYARRENRWVRTRDLDDRWEAIEIDGLPRPLIELPELEIDIDLD